MLDFITYFIGAMAVAATIGAANSLYAIVDSRRRELAWGSLQACCPALKAARLPVTTALRATWGRLSGTLTEQLITL